MSPVALWIFNEPTSTAIVMHSSVNLQVQQLQAHLQLQSTTRQKAWKFEESKRKGKKIQAVQFFSTPMRCSHMEDALELSPPG